nr:uncharacterized protein At2g29880-like [Ziziphus jujuba var. spinosa]
MGDSQRKGKTAYNTWTSQESNMLLELMVDAANRGWRDNNGSHSNQKHLRTDTFADFEDLKIAVGNGIAIGKNSIGLGDDTDARIYGEDESTHGRIDDYVYDEINEIYVPTQLDPSCQAPSPGHNEPSMSEFDPNLEVPMENNATRVDLLEKLSHGLDSIGKIATEIRGMYNLMQKRENAISEKEKKNDIWNAIKETPNLDNIGRYKALALIQKMGVKDAFLKMLPEERSEWISLNME